MGFLGKFKQDNSVTTIEVDKGYQSFSTPFTKIPNGNLSLPLIWAKYERQGIVPFGEDNLFPNHLNQVYYSSPLHSSIVDFKVNASTGGGYDINESKMSAKDKVALYSLKSRLGLDQLIQQICEDKVVHERNYFLCDLKDGVATKIKRVGAEKVRVNKTKTQYAISDDWLNSNQSVKFEPLTNECLLKKKSGTYLLCFEDCTLGQDIYPLPKYTSALNFAFLSGELSYLSKSNIQNSVFPSFALMFPKKPQNNEEMDAIKSTVGKMKGAENAGKGVAFFASNVESLPKMEVIPPNQNTNLFKEASELNTEQICFAHTIDPILLGVRTSGALGSGSDIKQAYVIFEKNVVIPLRTYVENVVNTLFKVSGIDAKIELVNYQIINETITEVEDNEVVKALMALPESLRNKVIEKMTDSELRALANLNPIV